MCVTMILFNFRMLQENVRLKMLQEANKPPTDKPPIAKSVEEDSSNCTTNLEISDSETDSVASANYLDESTESIDKPASVPGPSNSDSDVASGETNPETVSEDIASVCQSTPPVVSSAPMVTDSILADKITKSSEIPSTTQTQTTSPKPSTDLPEDNMEVDVVSKHCPKDHDSALATEHGKTTTDSVPNTETVCNGLDSPISSTTLEKHVTTTTTVTTTMTKTVLVDSETSQSSENQISTVTTSSTKVETTTTSKIDVVSTSVATDSKSAATELNSLSQPPYTSAKNENDRISEPEKSKVVFGSYDSIFKSSSMEVDPSLGLTTEVTHRQVSRRFRTVKKAGITKHIELSKVTQSATSKTWKLKRSPADTTKKKLKDVKVSI